MDFFYIYECNVKVERIYALFCFVFFLVGLFVCLPENLRYYVPLWKCTLVPDCTVTGVIKYVSHYKSECRKL